MKKNYHTHTERCGHAWGTDEAFVLGAIRGGFSELGFSDHGCWNYASGFKSHMRMTVEGFDEYFESIQKLKEKYKDQISVKIGMECEYFPRYMGWLEQFVKEKKLDYIIFGNHFDTTDEFGAYYGLSCNDDKLLTKYIDDCIAGMSTGLYSYLAHPDLFMRGRDEFDALARKESERLCGWCRDHGVVMEYNLEGAQMSVDCGRTLYPYPDFWEIAAGYGCDVIIGVDAHEPKSLSHNVHYRKAVNDLTELGMNLVTELPVKF